MGTVELHSGAQHGPATSSASSTKKSYESNNEAQESCLLSQNSGISSIPYTMSHMIVMGLGSRKLSVSVYQPARYIKAMAKNANVQFFPSNESKASSKTRQLCRVCDVKFARDACKSDCPSCTLTPPLLRTGSCSQACIIESSTPTVHQGSWAAPAIY